MTREELKEAMPILTAFAEGKVIEFWDYKNKEWNDIENIDMPSLLNWPYNYRTKPEQTYRPFNDGEECWETVQKDGFDWVKIKGDPTNLSVGIAEVNESNVVLSGSLSEEPLGYEEAFEKLTFVDGTPFGMKKE